MFDQSRMTNTKLCRPIRDQLVVVRGIATQILISWLQITFGNTLLKPTSFINCSVQQHVVFYIVIVDLNSKTSLVGFIRLYDSGNYDRKGLFVTPECSTINIATVSHQYCSYIFYRSIHLLQFICCNCTLIYDFF